MTPEFRRAWAASFHHRQKFRPRADFLLVAAGHSAGDLEEMREIMRGPGGEELAQRDGAEGGMRALQFEVLGLEMERVDAGQALAPKCGELVQKGGERLARTVVAELRLAVDGI